MGTPTKRPWKVVGDDEICRGHVLVAGTFQPDIYYLPAEKRMSLPPVAECKANARLIVRSVNSHDALVKALAKIAEHMNADNEQSYRADDPEGAMDTVYELAVAALRLAKGGPE